jgi:hypothetical protein
VTERRRFRATQLPVTWECNSAIKSAAECAAAVKLNGEQMVDYTEADDVQRPPKRSGRRIDPSGGAIAIQAHDPDSVYFFKEIRIRELP